MVKADFEGTLVLEDDLSNSGLIQQLKSAPSMRQCVDILGNLSNSIWKKFSLSQLGPYILARMTGVLYRLPETNTYLPQGSEMISAQVKLIDL